MTAPTLICTALGYRQAVSAVSIPAYLFYPTCPSLSGRRPPGTDRLRQRGDRSHPALGLQEKTHSSKGHGLAGPWSLLS